MQPVTPHSVPSRRNGFTLIELLVVVSIIVLLAGVALPSLGNLMTSGADAQAYNLLSAQLTYARAQAAMEGNYIGLHVQMSDRVDSIGDQYVATCEYNRTDGIFELADSFSPKKVPGGLAFGEVSFTTGTYGDLDKEEGLTDLTTFSIVFNARGQLVEQVNNAGIEFQADDLFETGDQCEPDDNDSDRIQSGTHLWRVPDTEDALSTITLFDYSQFILLTGSDPDEARGDFLQETAQYIPINRYTGQMYPRR